MKLYQYREKVHTECNLKGNPVLSVQAIKVDSNHKSLKQVVGCNRLKSCDYLKRKKNKLFFIEISDFDAQFKNLSTKIPKATEAYIKMEVRLKLSDSLLMYKKLIEKFTLNTANINLKYKALLVTCSENKSDAIFMDRITKDLQRHYCPSHYSSVKVIPYLEVENIFKK